MKKRSIFNKFSALIIFVSLVLVVISITINLSSIVKKSSRDTALVIIDVQDFYFPGGSMPLVNPEKAAANIGKLLEKFRKDKRPIIHIRHNSSRGAEIYKSVAPAKGEEVITKNYANSFRETEFLKVLKENNINNLIITGMQTHMCVEAAVRAAADFGFKCTVISDACATRDLTFKNKTIRAEEVHNSTLSSLSRTYAEITDTETYLKKHQDQ